MRISAFPILIPSFWERPFFVPIGSDYESTGGVHLPGSNPNEGKVRCRPRPSALGRSAEARRCQTAHRAEANRSGVRFRDGLKDQCAGLFFVLAWHTLIFKHPQKKTWCCSAGSDWKRLDGRVLSGLIPGQKADAHFKGLLVGHRQSRGHPLRVAAGRGEGEALCQVALPKFACSMYTGPFSPSFNADF